MGCLYKLTSPSGKSYIGITTLSVERRWRQHRSNANKGRGYAAGHECQALYNAIRKYGAATFTVEQLDSASEWSDLCEMEREAIREHGTRTPQGYNLTSGGDGTPGVVVSKATREKLAAGQRLRLQDPEKRSVMLRAIKKASEVRSERWWNRTPGERAEWGLRHSQRVRNGHSTPEAKERTLKAARLRGENPENRATLSRAQTGVRRAPWTDERKRVAAAQRRREWADPAMRAKRLAGFAKAREA